MVSLAMLTQMIGMELQHTLQESEHSDRNNPRGYAAGFDAGRAEALRWLLRQVASGPPSCRPHEQKQSAMSMMNAAASMAPPVANST
jgi:hypothetical protein